MVVIIGDEKFAVYQLGETFEQIKKDIFEVALWNTNGNKTKAADTLNVHIKTLRSVLNKIGMEENDEM